MTSQGRSPYPRLVWTLERIQTFWNFQSQDATHYFSYQVAAALLKFVHPFIKKAKSILDFGCGPGFLIAELLAQGHGAVWGTDVSEESLRQVKEKFGGRPGFGDAMPLDRLLASQKMFDAIFALEVVEHLEDSALEELFKRLRALLPADGCVILTTPNEENL